MTLGESDTMLGFATVRLNNGNGTFGRATSYATDTSATSLLPLKLALVDLNSDSKLDLIAATRPSGGEISVRLGAGDGTFGASVSYAGEPYATDGIALLAT